VLSYHTKEDQQYTTSYRKVFILILIDYLFALTVEAIKVENKT